MNSANQDRSPLPLEVTPAGTASAFDDLLEKVSSECGTPFYLYDAAELASRSRELRSVLPGEASPRLLYSFKANPLPSVANELRVGGCEADLTSPGELHSAMESGFDLSRALYGGPGKSAAEYSGAIASGVRHFSVESCGDLSRLSKAAGELGEPVAALLRINPNSAPKAKLAMSGVASQFGFEEEELRSLGARIHEFASAEVKLAGFHLYWGTQIAETDAILASFEKTVELADELAAIAGMEIGILNLGGGFAWPYAHRGEGTDPSPLREGLAGIHARSGASRSAEWWFESGRYLAGSSGMLVSRVMEVKRSKDDRWFLILDTGIHHLGGMAGLGRIPRFSIDLIVPESRIGAGTRVVDVVGPLCTPLDCLAKRLELPVVEPGDLVAIPNVGAYGATASVGAFLSRPAPPEVLHRDGKILAIHRLRTGHERVR